MKKNVAVEANKQNNPEELCQHNYTKRNVKVILRTVRK